jgi:hypothetical protein
MNKKKVLLIGLFLALCESELTENLAVVSNYDAVASP